MIMIPSEKILGEIRLNLTFHSENTKCDPLNFNVLKIFSISCLNSEVSLDVVALSPLAKRCNFLSDKNPVINV
jgi:hypothetical protein